MISILQEEGGLRIVFVKDIASTMKQFRKPLCCVLAQTQHNNSSVSKAYSVETEENDNDESALGLCVPSSDVLLCPRRQTQ